MPPAISAGLRLLADHGPYVKSPKTTPLNRLPPSLGTMSMYKPGNAISAESAPDE